MFVNRITSVTSKIQIQLTSEEHQIQNLILNEMEKLVKSLFAFRRTQTYNKEN